MALLAVNDRAAAINGDADKGVVRGIGTTGLEPLTTQARRNVEVPAIIGLDVGCRFDMTAIVHMRTGGLKLQQRRPE